MKAKNLSAHIAATYRTLRLVLVVIGFTFPPLLWVGYGILKHDWHLQSSMSAYYFAGDGAMRDWFVGLFFATGALLFVYHGFTTLEDWVLNLAAGCALGVALFPMEWPPGTRNGWFSLHGVFAVSFFLCSAYICIFQASATLTLIKDETKRNRYQRTYSILGAAMVAAPALAFSLSLIPAFRNSIKFLVEAAGSFLFALYWLIKSREISETQADQEAASGKLQAPQINQVSDAFRRMQVYQIDGGNSAEEISARS